MKCTDCQTTISPVVALDIDGTLGQYHQHFIDFLGPYLGRNGVYPAQWSGLGEFSDFLGLTKQEYREAKLAYRQGGWKRWMPPYVGASELVIRLRRLGAEVWLCTTRPWLRLDNIDPDTREWCSRNNIYFDGMLFGEDKYVQLLDRVEPRRIVAVVDDDPVQLKLLVDLGLPAIFREHDYNTSTHFSPGYASLTELRSSIAFRLSAWKDVHGWK
jgi:hypothetical protein